MDEKALNWMFDDLGNRGLTKSTIAPPAFRLAWKLGVQVAPPMFASFVANFLIMGIFFGVAWGGMMWLMFWQNQTRMTGSIALLAAAGAGIMFGLCMATYYRILRSRHKLPDWEDYARQAREASSTVM
jgi:hypothetical protein